jgi:hypothetical protein
MKFLASWGQNTAPGFQARQLLRQEVRVELTLKKFEQDVYGDIMNWDCIKRDGKKRREIVI